MNEDPRWGQAISLLKRLKATEGAPADTEFVERFQQLIETLEAITADPAAAAQERSAAQRMPDKMATLISGHAPQLIRKVVEIAGDAAAAPASRAEAQRLLDDITERMPPASDKLH